MRCRPLATLGGVLSCMRLRRRGDRRNHPQQSGEHWRGNQRRASHQHRARIMAEGQPPVNPTADDGQANRDCDSRTTTAFLRQLPSSRSQGRYRVATKQSRSRVRCVLAEEPAGFVRNEWPWRHFEAQIGPDLAPTGCTQTAAHRCASLIGDADGRQHVGRRRVCRGRAAASRHGESACSRRYGERSLGPAANEASLRHW